MASFTLVEGFRELIQAPACPQSLFVHAPANVDLVGGWLVMAVKQLRASALVVSLDLTELSTPKAVCERVVCECEAASSRTASQRAGQDSATLDGMFGILRQTGHHRDEGSGQTFLVFEHAEKCSAWDDGRFLAAMLAIGELVGRAPLASSARRTQPVRRRRATAGSTRSSFRPWNGARYGRGARGRSLRPWLRARRARQVRLPPLPLSRWCRQEPTCSTRDLCHLAHSAKGAHVARSAARPGSTGVRRIRL